MCIVSAVLDYGRNRIPPAQWTPTVWNEYKEIIRRLEALDSKLSQPDCEDPEKAAWMKDIEERVKALEDASTPDTPVYTLQSFGLSTGANIV